MTMITRWRCIHPSMCGRLADGTRATDALRLPMADGFAATVVAADFVMREHGPTTSQIADDAATVTVIGAGG